MPTPFRVALVTVPNEKTASRLARGLVERRLAACVNVVPGLVSHYAWEGRLCEDKELLLVIKTRAALLRRLEAYVAGHHPAKVPELIVLPILAGSRAYLCWLAESIE